LTKVNFDLVKHRRVIGINNAYGDPVLDGDGRAIKDTEGRLTYKPRDWVDACWFHDGRWFSWHYQSLRDFSGIIAHCAAHKVTQIGTHYFHRGNPTGIDKRPAYVAPNGNAGFSSINFAYHLGVRRVVLLGYDMRVVEGDSNWHKDHPIKYGTLPYPRYLKRAKYVAADALALGLDIINCTPGSAITCWPIMSLEEYLDKEEEEVEDGSGWEVSKGQDPAHPPMG
jgi:hypothetical protein